ncbi:4'-phosphopantetheinyl transferase superfamily protein [Streptacidiphilus sp. 4-A2]|nr:4'-phosphopantetheinyl transferase superfamily protein [Streptacidiphilus sp. 4-A2]
MLLTRNQLESYRRDGFLLMESLLEPAEVDALRSAFVRDCEVPGPQRIAEDGGAAVRAVYASHQRQPEFADLIRDPRLLRPVEQLLGADSYVYQFKINAKPAFGGEKWSWHQDFTAWQIADNLPAPLQVNIGIFLDDVTEFNGPVIYLPDRTARRLLNDRRAERAKSEQHLDPDDIALTPEQLPVMSPARGMVSPKGPAGSVVFFSSELHGSAPNMSPMARRCSSPPTTTSPTCPVGRGAAPRLCGVRDTEPLSPLDGTFLRQRELVGSDRWPVRHRSERGQASRREEDMNRTDPHSGNGTRMIRYGLRDQPERLDEGKRPALAAGQVDLWLLRQPDARRAGDELDLAVLDGGELKRAGACRRPEDGRLYASAHIALRRVLSAYLGIQPGSIGFVREPCPCCEGLHGRPAVAAAQPGLHFSLSHGRGMVLVGVAPVPIGADVEALPDPETVETCSAALHPQEQAELQALPPAARSAAFARIWTRKEAYLKGIGTGLARDPAADFLGADLAARPPGWTVLDISCGPRHAAAAAVLGGPPTSVSVRWLSADVLRARPGVPGPRPQGPGNHTALPTGSETPAPEPLSVPELLSAAAC